MLPIHTVLHPTDFSEQSMHAFRVADALARDYHAQLVLFHVLRSQVLLYVESQGMPQLENCVEEMQDQLLTLQTDPSVEVVRKLAEGNPADEILQEAQADHADVIVMGTHGRSNLARLVMGSVTAKVMRRSQCPVITVRAPIIPLENPTADWHAASAPKSTFTKD